MKDAARALADRREELARLTGKVGAARSRAAAAQAEIERLAAARDEARERAAAAQEEYETLRAEVDGLDADDAELAGQHDGARQRLAQAEAALTAAREAATAAERERAATRARHEALALGLRRKDGTGALLAAQDRLTGLLGPAAELLTVVPGHETALAAAFGAAADALAVTGPSAAAEAIRLLRKQDAGRAALLLAAAPDTSRAGAHDGPHERRADGAYGAHEPSGGHEPLTGVPDGPRYAADLVRGPVELLPAVRRLLRGTVVVGTLEDAEELLYARPELTAVTAEGDLLGAHFAHGGSAGAPSLLEVQASVDEAAAELEELAVRCEELTRAQHAATEERGRCAALVEELGERRRAADREKSSVAQQLGRLAGQARGAAGEAERSAAAAARSQEALDKALGDVEELAERLAVAEEMPFDEEPDTSVRDRLAADGANARQTEMEARLQVRTHEERVKGLTGRADSLERAARTEREARARAEQRRARLRHEAAVAEAVAAGARHLLAHVEVSSRVPKRSAPPPRRRRPTASRNSPARGPRDAISRQNSTS